MNIDNLLANYNLDKFKSDCLIHDFVKAYIEKKSNLSLCKDKEADMLSRQFENFSIALERVLRNTICFPSGCKDCMGMQKCAGCINQDDLGDALIKLQKYLY